MGGDFIRTWLKEMRESQEKTQQQVAKEVNLDVTSINKYELGERRPSVENAKKIANILNFDWKLFFPDEKDIE